jgi:peptidoglycan/LPS O-acetylase OafA/YrhL
LSVEMLRATAETAAPAVTRSSGDRIPSLDGLRALSIAAVILGHAVATHGVPQSFLILSHAGNLGVRMFFVISGFLITSLLIKELAATGTVSIRGFYLRRTFRILPAYLFYVLVVFLMASAGAIELLRYDLAHALTFTMNYSTERAWALNHTWSLSVEEQFYLLWPAVLIVAGYARALWVSWATILIVPVVRAVMWYAGDASDTSMTREFQAVCDALMTGAALACLVERNAFSPRYLAFIRSNAALLVAAALLLASFAAHRIDEGLFYVLMQSFANFGTLLVLHHAVLRPAGFLGVVLNWRPLAFMGLVSYSLYLWQQLFLNGYVNEWYTRFPQNVALTFIVGVLSYYVIEKPFIALGVKLRKRPAVSPPTVSRQISPE